MRLHTFRINGTLVTLLLYSSPLAALAEVEEEQKPRQPTSPGQALEAMQKSGWADIRVAFQSWIRGLPSVEYGRQSRNLGQQWTTKFNRRVGSWSSGNHSATA